MVRRFSIVAVLAMTVLMGAWLLTISAGVLQPGEGDVDSAPAVGVESEPGAGDGLPFVRDAYDDAYEDRDEDHDDDDHDEDDDDEDHDEDHDEDEEDDEDHD